jgi:hypothetical protein
MAAELFAAEQRQFAAMASAVQQILVVSLMTSLLA